MSYKKMAGTAAVFVFAEQHADKPVERQGMEWSENELHMQTIGECDLIKKPPMATSLALEGLESYDPPSHGDVREVSALNATFVYVEPIKGWVEILADEMRVTEPLVQ